jgi:hypothetical protein
MSATAPTEQSIDLDALRADAEKHLADLREQRARLSLDAISDTEVREELESVEAEIRDTEAELQRFELAADERSRREQEAREQAEAKARARAKREADDCERELDGLAVDFDKAAASFASVVVRYSAKFGQRQGHLIAAGLVPWGAGLQPGGLGAALRFALQHAGSDGGVLRLVDVRDPGAGPDRPLTEGAR